jgi:hypothetical protein
MLLTFPTDFKPEHDNIELSASRGAYTGFDSLR